MVSVLAIIIIIGWILTAIITYFVGKTITKPFGSIRFVDHTPCLSGGSPELGYVDEHNGELVSKNGLQEEGKVKIYPRKKLMKMMDKEPFKIVEDDITITGQGDDRIIQIGLRKLVAESSKWQLKNLGDKLVKYRNDIAVLKDKNVKLTYELESMKEQHDDRLIKLKNAFMPFEAKKTTNTKR